MTHDLLPKKSEIRTIIPFSNRGRLFSELKAFLMLNFTASCFLLYVARNTGSISVLFTLEGTRNKTIVHQIPISHKHESSFPSSFSNYIRWHKEARQCFESGCTEKDHIGILIWRCERSFFGCSGLGDRLRSIQFYLLLSIVTRRLFFIQWPEDGFNYSKTIIPAAINWYPPKNLQYEKWPVLEHKRWPYMHWKSCPSIAKGLYVHLKHERNASIPKRYDLSKVNISASLQLSRNIQGSGHTGILSVPNLSKNMKIMHSFEDLSTIRISELKLQRHLLQSLFQPSTELNGHIKTLIPANAMSNGFSSFHARVGADVGEQRVYRFTNLPGDIEIASTYLNCINKVGLKPNMPIFVATDSVRLKTRFLNFSKTLNHPLFVSYKDAPAMHIIRSSKKAVGHLKERQVTGITNVFIDFFIMSKSEIILSNGSGLSRMAYILGNGSIFLELSFGRREGLLPDMGYAIYPEGRRCFSHKSY